MPPSADGPPLAVRGRDVYPFRGAPLFPFTPVTDSMDASLPPSSCGAAAVFSQPLSMSMANCKADEEPGPLAGGIKSPMLTTSPKP
ncbi:hypothetical protein JCM6882_001866 [Rhodosporidiobolus microsporus]